MRKLKVMVVFGTRPEAIKLAPVINELKSRSDKFETLVTVTAQHREMLDQVLTTFSIIPDYDLDIMTKNQTLIDITNKCLSGLNEVFKNENLDLIVVHGDTSTTFVASLAAFYNQIPVAHVEAGLRTGDKYSPFPEEANRQLTGILADLHFAPTTKSAINLLKENKDPKTIFVTGNTAIDALTTTITDSYDHPIFAQLKGNKFILLTAHRRENLGENMENIFRAVLKIVNEYPDIDLIYPVHLNPIIKNLADKMLKGHERIHMLNPLEVIDFHNISSKAHIILTDSGGVQEEAPSLGIPVLVLRDSTERPEGIDAGTLKLAGTNEEEIYFLTKELIENEDMYMKMASTSNPYGDGNASYRIAEGILHYFGMAQKPKDFEHDKDNSFIASPVFS